MNLTSFTYKEPGWTLAPLSPLQTVNLLVAKNATGKSRTVRAIHAVASFLQMKEANLPRSFAAELCLCGEGDGAIELKYTFSINEGAVESETLTAGDKTLIQRTSTGAKLGDVCIAPPAERLVVQTRRDEQLYPEIELLMHWAEGVVFLSFSEISPLAALDVQKERTTIPFGDLVDALTAEDKVDVLTKARTLGYDVESMSTFEAVKGVRLVRIKERTVADEMLGSAVSNGMMRTLYLLCFTAAMKHKPRLSLLLIDDFGEGLDFQRSNELGRIFFNDGPQTGVQLIVSSNDAFLMDVVDIANWQLLRRTNSMVHTLNAQTHPELFRQFRMTGLSNFDLFSSDFVESYLNKQHQ